MPHVLDELRATVARLERHHAGEAAPGIVLGSGVPNLALQRAAFHEVLVADPGAAIGFSASILSRTAGSSIWISQNPDVWPEGLAAFGLAASDQILVDASSQKDGLWAFEEAVRSPGIAGAVLMTDGPGPDLVAGRRLQIAAEAGGGVGLLLLPDTDRLSPSAARSRWRLGACQGAWNVALLRAAGGRSGSWQVAWDRERQELRSLKPTADWQTDAERFA